MPSFRLEYFSPVFYAPSCYGLLLCTTLVHAAVVKMDEISKVQSTLHGTYSFDDDFEEELSVGLVRD